MILSTNDNVTQSKETAQLALSSLNDPMPAGSAHDPTYLFHDSGSRSLEPEFHTKLIHTVTSI